MNASSRIEIKSRLALTMPAFVSLLEHPHREEPARFSFMTAVVDDTDIRRYVDDLLDELEITPREAKWSEQGLVLNFATKQDHALFSIAFRGPRMH